MKQLLFCYKDIYNAGDEENPNWKYRIRIRSNILSDVSVNVQDVISPQKTTLTIPKTNNIELSDIIIIRDNDSGEVEYIGYIDTLSNKNVTEISCYPIINVFDNDFVLDQMFKKSTNQDGSSVDIAVDCVDWLKKQIERAFVNTDDKLQALPFIVRNMTNRLVLHKKVLDTSNLFEAYTDLFIEKGIYIKFSDIVFDANFIKGIYCDIYCNCQEKPLFLRFDDPSIQSVDIVDNTFTNYNKIIATEELEEGSEREPQRICFYLLRNNSITTDPNNSNRIKQVRSKELTFKNETQKEEGETEEQLAERNAKSLMQKVFNELQAPEYNLQITITMLKNQGVRLYRKVNFTSDKTYFEDGSKKNLFYETNITKIEELNEKQLIITLGALRNSLTDFKKKVEVI